MPNIPRKMSADVRDKMEELYLACFRATQAGINRDQFIPDSQKVGVAMCVNVLGWIRRGGPMKGMPEKDDTIERLIEFCNSYAESKNA